MHLLSATSLRWLGPKEIKRHVENVLLAQRSWLSGRRALDIPCGNGHSLEILMRAGAHVSGADLFPELNRESAVSVTFADLGQRLPYETSQFDFILCQEGIEHLGNQDHVFAEFSRLLAPGGRLLVTTPNYSNLKSRLSYLLTEGEAFGRLAPPNEEDSVWLSETQGGKVYFGHVFLTGILRLRLFALLSGLKIRTLHASRVNYTSVFLFPLLYPLILFYSFRTMRRFGRKTKNQNLSRELLQLMISPQVLLENHLIVEFEKVASREEAIRSLALHRDTRAFTT